MRGCSGWADAEGLEQACAEILPGDDVGVVFDLLGRDGYRPGCSKERPCERGDFGSHPDVPYLCDGVDCSLYWRVGALGCLVDWKRGRPGVEGAELVRLPG